jgi:hypothetical protein
MNLLHRQQGWLAAVPGLLLASSGLLFAQSDHPSSNALAHSNLTARALPIAPLPPPPLPAAAKPPVALFRELLGMSPVERRNALTNRTPENQKLILAKIREYQSLKPSERELRLRVTELRWYLLPLMQAPSTNRMEQLLSIPPEDRALVGSRLRAWDQLAQDVQKSLLDNEATVRYFTECTTDEQRSNMFKNISPARLHKLEEGLDQWQRMPEDERQKLATRFNQYFNLTAEEKQKALLTLSEPERKQIEKTLRSFDSLPPAQRAQCIRSFEKFASLTVEDRQEFLKNAERWKLMTPEQRQSWRDLVTQAPQLPVRFDTAPLPPIVTLPPRSGPPAPFVTNGN